MGIFTSKIVAGVVAGGMTLAGAGLLWTGTDTINTVKSQLNGMADQIVQYESNEGSLLTKVGQANTNIASANGTIGAKNSTIANKNNTIADLNNQIVGYKTSVRVLTDAVVTLNEQWNKAKAELATSQADAKEKQNKIDELKAQLDAKIAELATCNEMMTDLKAQVATLEGQLKDADSTVTGLEAELDKANAEVDALKVEADAAKAKVGDASAMTPEEVDAVTVTDTVE